MKKVKNKKKKNYLKKRLNKIKKLIDLNKKIKEYKKEIKQIKKISKEDYMKNLIKDEIKEYKNKIKKLKNKIKEVKHKNKKTETVIVELKIGVGGEESAIFINDLIKMYKKYAEKKHWKIKIMSESKTNLGGYKEIIMMIKGKSIYRKLKYESGVHRVQRSPKTESRGKIHTSTCRVAIYKKKNLKFEIKDKDLKIETFKSSGAGGQHVNKTNSAVRIKHIPTNMTVECQNERSQHKNKKHALKVIKTKLLLKNSKETEEIENKIKKNLLGKGKREEKIRTYNYKDNRITEHKRNFIIKNLDWIMQGNLDELIKKIENSKNDKKKK